MFQAFSFKRPCMSAATQTIQTSLKRTDKHVRSICIEKRGPGMLAVAKKMQTNKQSAAKWVPNILTEKARHADSYPESSNKY